MNKIAVLLTCHNRKNKTIKCLENLFNAENVLNRKLTLDIYLTDDGSTDGTGKIVASRYPEVNLIKGDGSLYWAGGMRKSWISALNYNYQGYLLINDDTVLYENLFYQLFKSDTLCKEKFGKSGIYIGSTQDPESLKLTYGGARLESKFLFKFSKLEPTGNIQECDLGNANIMYVPNEVVAKIGILDKRYVHGVADFDYTLKAKKNKIPVLITPEYCGACKNDHQDIYEIFSKASFKERINILVSPINLSFYDNLVFNFKHFPMRLPLVILSGLFKVLFPGTYIFLRHKNS